MPAAVSQAGTNRDAQDRHDQVQERVPPSAVPVGGPREVADAGGIHQDVDRHEHDHDAGAGHRERVHRVVGEAEAERDRDGEDEGNAIARTGERCLGWTRASAAGKARIRPIANDIRDAMFTPALALAIVELTIARKTKNQNSPYSVRAMPSQDASPDT